MTNLDELDKSQIPRQRKIPKRLDQDTSENFKFKTPQDFFKKSYFEVFDQLIVSLKSRFDNDSAQFFKLLERFALEQPADIDKIVKFYKNNFDKGKLLSDKDMFLQLLKRQMSRRKI